MLVYKPNIWIGSRKICLSLSHAVSWCGLLHHNPSPLRSEALLSQLFNINSQWISLSRWFIFTNNTHSPHSSKAPLHCQTTQAQPEKERHEGTFEDGCRRNNRWLAYTIKKIYALVQVQIIRTFIFREGMCAWRERVYNRGLFQDDKVLFVIAQKVFTWNHMTVI